MEVHNETTAFLDGSGSFFVLQHGSLFAKSARARQA